MDNFHVLSNYDIECIIAFAAFAAIVPVVIFGNLGQRDASPAYKKGKVAKIVPWVLLLFFSDSALIITRLVDYPWNIEPQPSKASAFREMEELVIDPIWGWANDYQMDIVGKIGGCVCTLCWTAYAFCFKRSDTNRWKKTFKVIAYFLLSMVIIGFSFHSIVQLLAILIMFVLPATILLFFARVKPKKINTTMNTSTTTAAERPLDKTSNDVIAESEKEDDSRFMPHDVSHYLNKEEQNEHTINEEVENGHRKPFHQLTEPIESICPVELTDNDIMPKSVMLSHVTKSEEPVDPEMEKTRDSSNIMFCKYCGKGIESDSAFCKYCGKKL